MAFISGNATNHSNFWSTLLSALKTNATLVSAGQQWTQVWSVTNQVVLRGPGLAGDDNVYIGLKLVSDPTNDSYYIQMRGMTDILDSATDIAGHVNVSKATTVFLDSQPFSYWIVANGRRFAIVLKISTVFQAGYAGLFLPYATPDSYPYPLFVGGTCGENLPNTPNWRSVEDCHTQFISPNYGAPAIKESCAWMLDPAAQWVRCWNNGSDPGNPKIGMAPELFHAGLGAVQTAGVSTYGYDTIRQRQSACYGGAFALTPISLVQAVPTDQTFGILDGCYRVPGIGNSSENLVTVDGLNHLVVQNVFRTGTGQYWALGLG